jgi:hypothetical protein
MFRFLTLSQRPELRKEIGRLNRERWPVFMRKDPVAARYWESLLTAFADFQIFLCDEHDEVTAMGQTIPLAWDGTVERLSGGWDAMLEQGVQQRAQQIASNTLSALAIVVAPSHQHCAGASYSQKSLPSHAYRALCAMAAGGWIAL